MTQLVDLTLLAPAIQAEILAMPLVTVGRDLITERPLRSIVAEAQWEGQLAMWKALGASASGMVATKVALT